MRLARRLTVTLLVLALVLESFASVASAKHAQLTARQRQYRDLYSATVGVFAHKVIEAYLRDQYLHVPPHSPGALSPQPRAYEVLQEGLVPLAKVVFDFPVPDDPGNGGKLDFAAKYYDGTGICFWEVHEIKPVGWHYQGLAAKALTQLTSYTSAISRDADNFDKCIGVPATRWQEGQPGWKTIPNTYAPVLGQFNVKLQVQTWYASEPGIVYYRFVWRDRDKRQKALRESSTVNLAQLVHRIARNELPVSNRYVYGELIPWMHSMYHEDREAGGIWEDEDALQQLIDIRLSMDDSGTAVDEDEHSDYAGCYWDGCSIPMDGNAVDPDVTTQGMVKYWEAWSTPDPWYFKDWRRALTEPPFPPILGMRCTVLEGEDQPYGCAA